MHDGEVSKVVHTLRFLIPILVCSTSNPYKLITIWIMKLSKLYKMRNSFVAYLLCLLGWNIS